jgi:hypothetical protein
MRRGAEKERSKNREVSRRKTAFQVVPLEKKAKRVLHGWENNPPYWIQIGSK